MDAAAAPQNKKKGRSCRQYPPYKKMIVSAIEALKERRGSSRKAIAKYINHTYTGLPTSHNSLLTTHLARLRSRGLIRMVKFSYKLPTTTTTRSRREKEKKNPVQKKEKKNPRSPTKPDASSITAAAIVVFLPRGINLPTTYKLKAAILAANDEEAPATRRRRRRRIRRRRSHQKKSTRSSSPPPTAVVIAPAAASSSSTSSATPVKKEDSPEPKLILPPPRLASAAGARTCLSRGRSAGTRKDVLATSSTSYARVVMPSHEVYIVPPPLSVAKLLGRPPKKKKKKKK